MLSHLKMPGAGKIFLSLSLRKEHDKNSLWGMLVCCGCEERVVEKCGKDSSSSWAPDAPRPSTISSAMWLILAQGLWTDIVSLPGNAVSSSQCMAAQLSFPVHSSPGGPWLRWQRPKIETTCVYLWVTSCWKLLWGGTWRSSDNLCVNTK